MLFDLVEKMQEILNLSADIDISHMQALEALVDICEKQKDEKNKARFLLKIAFLKFENQQDLSIAEIAALSQMTIASIRTRLTLCKIKTEFKNFQNVISFDIARDFISKRRNSLV
jgi:hypothetical protein